MIRVSKDWWKYFFNHTYLITDARSILDNALTRIEVNLLEKTLNLNKNDKILDLFSGQGRHSLELAKRGYKYLTALDYSPYLIKLGKRKAKETGLSIKFVKRDARYTNLKKEDYSVIFVMANSFGYFADERADLQVLKEIHRLLKRNGKLLLDLTDPDYVRNNLKPISWHKATQSIIVFRKRELKKDLIKAREIVISKNGRLIRNGSYCERIYTKDKISHFLRRVGFKNISIKKNVSLHKDIKDYGLMTSRMIVTAIKS